MPGSPTWLEWLSGLASGLCAHPAPGTHDAWLEQLRVGALLDKELCKPQGQRDEELVHTLRLDYRKRQLGNEQAQADICAGIATFYERAGPGEFHDKPGAGDCCAASVWVRRRVAASYRARHAFHCQFVQQVAEELAAAKARRPAVIAVQPALHLDLPEPLQQQPPRMDMCIACAEWTMKTELIEEAYMSDAETLQQQYQRRGMQAAPGGAGAAAAAADVRVGEAQHGQHAQQQQQQCASDAGGTRDAPVTPKQPPVPPIQQQHASSV